MHRKNYKLWLFVFCIAFLTFLAGRYSVSSIQVPSNSNTDPQVTSQESSSTSSYLGTGQTFDKYFVHVDKNKVLFTTFEGMGDFAGGEITRESYPNLFKSYSEGSNFIKVNELTDKRNNKVFSLVTNNVFSHGAYVETYGVIFDPEAGNVVYESPEVLSHSSLASLSYSENDGEIQMATYPYYFYASCTSCKLPIIDFKKYDPVSKKFISANNQHKSDFEKLLIEYEDIAEKKCEIGGKVVNVNELLKTQSPDTKCDDSNLPGKEEANKDFYTFGQFDELRQKIKAIVNGTSSTLID